MCVNIIQCDKGVSIPKDVDFQKTEFLGFQLVNALTSQLHGNITLDREMDIKFKIDFKELKLKPYNK